MSNMIPNSRAALATIAGAGICFVGYCIYFDRKRRSHPDFRKKLNEKRRTKSSPVVHSSKKIRKLPDVNDHEKMQVYFLEEIQEGEEDLSRGEIESGVEHISNAVVVCGQPQQLLEVLSKTLPPQVFNLIVQIGLPMAQQRLSMQTPQSMPKEASRIPTEMAEVDLE